MTWHTDEFRARVLLAHLAEPADARVQARITQIGAVAVAEEVVAAVPSGVAETLRHRLTDDPDRIIDADLAAAERIGAHVIVPGTSQWPTQLDSLAARAPLMLWVRGVGDLRLLALRSVSVVGARTATPYGESISRYWSAQFADAGWTVVSGGAVGIDAAAHQGAFDAGGTTICVLASGVDVPYPRAHDALIAQIASSGLVVSESPPGSVAIRHRFLTRNRIIAALSRATLVVEAGLRSGSRSTAGEAFELARPVLAVPGPVTSACSAGCHELVRTGMAQLVTGADDVLSLLDPTGSPPPATRGAQRPHDGLSPREARVFDAVPSRRAATLGSLVVSAGLGPTDVVAALGILQSRGLVTRKDGGWVTMGA